MPHDKIGIVTWDDGEGRGGLGRAVQWISEALGDRAEVVRVPRLCFGVSGRERAWRHVILPVGPGGPVLLRLPDLPYTALCYHTYADQAACVPGEGWKRVFLPYERRMLQRAERILCYSPDTVATLQRSYGLSSEKIMLLPQLFDIHHWQPEESLRKDPNLVVCVARLERRKGVEVLLRAWRSVSTRCPKARLILIGRCAPHRASLWCWGGRHSKKIDAVLSSIGEGCERIPTLPRAGLRSLVQRASVAVCPSYLEGFGLSCAEAMAAGTAVVASDVPGLRSLIRHGHTGLLVPAGDPDALGDATVLLLHDQALRQRLSSEAMRFVAERFQWQRACEALYAGVA